MRGKKKEYQGHPGQGGFRDRGGGEEKKQAEYAGNDQCEIGKGNKKEYPETAQRQIDAFGQTVSESVNHRPLPQVGYERKREQDEKKDHHNLENTRHVRRMVTYGITGHPSKSNGLKKKGDAEREKEQLPVPGAQKQIDHGAI